MSLETSAFFAQEIALREQLNAEVFDPPEFADLARAVESQFASVAVRANEADPWSGSNRQQARAILLTGGSRAGKSYALRQALAELEPIETVDGQTIAPKPLLVECSSIFDPAGLASQILHEIGYPASREFPTAVGWQKVRKHIVAYRPTVLVIEEYQYSFVPTGVGAKRMDTVRANIQGLFRSLLDVPGWATPIAFVGTQSCIEHLEKPEVFHVREKIRDIIRIAPVTTTTENLEQLREALETYVGIARIEWEVDDDLFQRLIHACSGARGLILDFLKDVVVAAARSDDKRLLMKHFTDAYRDHTGCHMSGNPFVETNWLNTNPNRLLEAVDGVTRAPVAAPKGRKKQ